MTRQLRGHIPIEANSMFNTSIQWVTKKIPPSNLHTVENIRKINLLPVMPETIPSVNYFETEILTTPGDCLWMEMQRANSEKNT